jgi:hypothetical protein
MSLSKERDALLSQLVDGELPVDEANQVLAGVLDELTEAQQIHTEGARQLHAMLQLRQALGPWRRQEPAKAIVTPPSILATKQTSQFGRQVISLAAAAMLGGILLAGGMFLRDLLTGRQLEAPIAQQITEPNSGPAERARPAIVVSPEQRRDIARAFSLHESVAGPLSWYAADDATIQVAPAEKGEPMRQPIAIVLRMTGELSPADGEAMPPKSYVVVCRNSNAATIELPQTVMTPNLRLRLLSTEADGQVKLQYVLSAGGPEYGQEEAALIGRRQVGLGQTSLGQLAVNDHLVNVDASAWVLGNQAE